MIAQQKIEFDRGIFAFSKKYILLILLLIILLPACEDFFLTEVDNVDLPGFKPQLVVNAYISPQDTVIRVWVTRSAPHVQNPQDYVPVGADASVFIAKKGESFVQLHYDESRSFVIDAEDFPIESDTYYLLQVETPRGEYVEAECYVPGFETVEMNISAPVSSTSNWGEQQNTVVWQVSITDEADKLYYRTGGYLRPYQILSDGDSLHILAGGIHDIYLEKGDEFFPDNAGSKYAFRGNYYNNFYYTSYPGDPNYYEMEVVERIDSVYIYIMKTDYHYYQFHSSVENYYYHDDDSPFSENVHIYSNIKGGLGAFGGFNKKVFLAPFGTEDK